MLIIFLILLIAGFMGLITWGYRIHSNHVGQTMLEGENGPLWFRRIRAGYNRGREVRPPGFVVWIPVEAPGYLWIGAETEADQIAKSIGLITEVQTGFREFDDAFFVSCSHPKRIKLFFQNKEVQGEIFKLFEQGYDELFFDGKKLSALYSEFRNEISSGGNALIRDAEAPLRALGEELRSSFLGADSVNYYLTKLIHYNGKWISMACMLISFPVLVFSNLIAPVMNLEAFFTSAPLLALPLGLAWLIGMGFYMRTHMIPAKKFLSVSFFSLVAVMVLLVSAQLLANRFFDSSAPLTAESTVVSKHVTHRKARVQHHFWASPSPYRGEKFKVSASKTQYDNAVEGLTRLEVTTRSGFLSHERLVSYRVLEY